MVKEAGTDMANPIRLTSDEYQYSSAIKCQCSIVSASKNGILRPRTAEAARRTRRSSGSRRRRPSEMPTVHPRKVPADAAPKTSKNPDAAVPVGDPRPTSFREVRELDCGCADARHRIRRVRGPGLPLIVYVFQSAGSLRHPRAGSSSSFRRPEPDHCDASPARLRLTRNLHAADIERG